MNKRRNEKADKLAKEKNLTVFSGSAELRIKLLVDTFKNDSNGSMGSTGEGRRE